VGAVPRLIGHHLDPATLVVEAADDGSIRKAELLVASRAAPVEPW